MKIALISDIHGHITAARAVIDDALKQGAEEFWFLGDLLMPGPGSSDVIELLNSVNTTVLIKGNWDSRYTDYLAHPEQYDLDEEKNLYIMALVHSMHERLTLEDDHFMNQMKMVDYKEVNGVKFQLTHHMPNKNSGKYLAPYKEYEHFEALMKDTDADVAIYGHTHYPLYMPLVDGRVVINPGPVLAFEDDASRYAILEVEEDGRFHVDFRQVAHNSEAEIKIAEERSLPYHELYIDTMKTGRSYTDDYKVHHQLSDKYGYRDVLEQWMKNR